jgi:hypothetical protein
MTPQEMTNRLGDSGMQVLLYAGTGKRQACPPSLGDALPDVF